MIYVRGKDSMWDAEEDAESRLHRLGLQTNLSEASFNLQRNSSAEAVSESADSLFTTFRAVTRVESESLYPFLPLFLPVLNFLHFFYCQTFSPLNPGSRAA